jgi:hypothetical protein
MNEDDLKEYPFNLDADIDIVCKVVATNVHGDSAPCQGGGGHIHPYQRVPDSCQNLHFSSRDDEDVVIGWDIPIAEGDSPVDGYQFSFNDVNYAYSYDPVYIDSDADPGFFLSRQVRLAGLTMGVTYSVCCSAHNRWGYGPATECMEFKAGHVPC